MDVSLWGTTEGPALDNASSFLFCRVKCFSFSRSESPSWAESHVFLSNSLAMAFSTIFLSPICSASTHFLLSLLSVVSVLGLFILSNGLVERYSSSCLTFFPSKELDSTLQDSDQGPPW